ncbi:MAG: hypothetical protein ACPGVD_04690 [Flavobacteriales bacterium]
MKKIIIILIAFLGLSILNCYSQYYTDLQITNINNSKTASEGDMYIDSINKNYYIGGTDGTLSKINQKADSIVFIKDSLLVFYWNFKEKDTANLLGFRDSSEWKKGSDIGKPGFVFAKTAIDNSDTVAISDDGKVGVGKTNSSISLDVAGKSQNENARATVSSTANVTTTSGSFVNVPGMTITVTTANSHLLILAGIPGVLNSNNDLSVNFRITVDGVQVGSIDESEQNNNGGILWTANLHALVPVSAGTHTVRLQWSVQGGTGSINSGQSTQFGPRALSVVEL